MAESKQKFGSVEVRRVEKEIGETGVGQANRTEVSYELGAEIDGRWTPFASLAEGRASDFWARADREAEGEAEKPNNAPKSSA